MKYAITDGEACWLQPTSDAEAVIRTAKYLLSSAKDPSVFQVLGIRNQTVFASSPLTKFCEINGIEKDVPSWRA